MPESLIDLHSHWFSPTATRWADTREAIDNIRRTPLDAASQRALFHDNAARLLRSKGVALTEPSPTEVFA